MTAASPLRDFRHIFAWEVKTGVRRVSIWVYFGIYFALAHFTILIAGGAFESFFGMDRSTPLLANSPHVLSGLITGLTLLGLPMTAAIAGNALYRDYEAGIDPLVYTTPLSKSGFLAGRFTGALAINLIVLAAIALGAATAAAAPFVKVDRMAAFELAAYVGPYLSFAIPNLVLTAAIFFAVVSMTRQMLPVYVGGVLLLVGYMISGALLSDIDNKRLAALLDPFGINAQDIVTEYWSVTEKNTLHIPLDGVILANRLIWLAVGFGIFALAYYRFRFAHAVNERRGAAARAIIDSEVMTRVQPTELPSVSRSFDLATHLTQFWSVTSTSFWRIVRNRYFAAIVGGGLLFLGFAAKEAGRIFGTPTWPVTYHMVELLTGTIGALILVIIAVYSGELVWAERDARSNQIADAAPVPTSVLFLGKVAGLAGMIAVLMFVALVAGIVTQALKGYYRFEIPLYLQALFGIRYVDILLLVPLAVAIHVFSNHKYIGHLLVILLVIGMGLLPLLGLERNLYLYGGDSGIRYSDMNGWGHFLRPFLWWKLYWIAFAALLLLVTNLFWVRGEDTRLRWRARLARRRFGKPARIVAVISGLVFAGMAGFLYYNTDQLNVFRTNKENRRLTAEREKRYKRYATSPQPRVTAVNVRVDLRPARQAFVATGHYVLRNKTAARIDTIHLGLSEEIEIRALAFDGGSHRLVGDSARDYHMYRLARALRPGDSTVMRFELAHQSRGIPNVVRNTFVVRNGSFLPSMLFLPAIGYSDALELADDDARRKEGLKPKERMRPPTDPTTRNSNYVTHDADWIRFEATVSTDEDQTALVPGYLQREWTENGRRVFQYTMDAPIINLWAILSGRYAVKRDRWRDTSNASAQPIDIAIYYHPPHTYNVDRMIAGVKRSLEYFTEQFGPYQHRQVRIAEFPRYAPFAQSLPNLIPYSEGLGFIARIEKPDDIDYPFYVTAHEVAHAWWAHQVIGADAQGATMLSESLAQYSALMVMEKEFGARNMRRFLAYELDNYLMSRGFEAKREMPLQLVENQPYIHYNKASLLMYALRDYIGEARVNRTLREFLDATKFRGPPYPTSLDLVAAFRAATPDSLKYLIADLFETITLYELRTDSAVVTRAPTQPGKFQVDLWVKTKKLRSDSLGKETAIAMRDWIDIGVYAKPPRGVATQDRNGVPLYLAKQRVDTGAQRFTVVVDRMPSRAGIDPLHKLTDREARNNTVNVRDRTQAP